VAGSITPPPPRGEISIAVVSAHVARRTAHGPWLVSIDYPGVTVELAPLPASQVVGPSFARFELATLTALYAALDRVYQVYCSA
jgi:hypothetical protein